MKPIKVKIYGEVLAPRPQKRDPSKMTKSKHWQTELLDVGRAVFVDKRVVLVYAFGGANPCTFFTRNGEPSHWSYAIGHKVGEVRDIHISHADVLKLRRLRGSK